MSRGTKNKIEDLRDHLFATLEALGDTEKPMDIERAKAISEVAQTIINSAKVEIDFMKQLGGTRAPTDFIPPEESKQLPAPLPFPRAALGSR